MKETKKHLIVRWELKFKPIHHAITVALQQKNNLDNIEIPRTQAGYVDLRGYSSPKQNRTGTTNKGQQKIYVESSLRIKKVFFNKVDFSYADLECCEFSNCYFNDCFFVQSRLVDTEFWGCEFSSIHFKKTNLADARFYANGLFFKKLKNNFKKVTFAEVNFSRGSFYNQQLNQVSINKCKTGSLIIDKCNLRDIQFSGRVFDLSIHESRSIKNIDLSKAEVDGLKLFKQPIEGFIFPVGEDYFLFNDMPKQLGQLKIPEGFSDVEIKIWNQIISIWTQYNDTVYFADINWLTSEEKVVGVKLLKELKKGCNRF